MCGVVRHDTIDTAREIVLRFHPTRGSKRGGRSIGGLPALHELVESKRAIPDDCIRLIDPCHDSAPGAMVRMGLDPCSTFRVRRNFKRKTPALARGWSVLLQTHLVENDACSLPSSGRNDHVPAAGACTIFSSRGGTSSGTERSPRMIARGPES